MFLFFFPGWVFFLGEEKIKFKKKKKIIFKKKKWGGKGGGRGGGGMCVKIEKLVCPG